MTTRRGSFQGRPRISVRRATAWEAGIGGTAVQTQAGSSVAILANAGVAALEDGLTIVRTRGRLHLRLGTAGAALNGFTGAFGIGVATSAAFTAGAASLPTPITEQGWDGWMYWRALQIVAVDVIDGGAANDKDGITGNVAYQSIEIDSKAMRKFTKNDTMFGMLEVIESGTAVLDWWVDSRILLKLS